MAEEIQPSELPLLENNESENVVASWSNEMERYASTSIEEAYDNTKPNISDSNVLELNSSGSFSCTSDDQITLPSTEIQDNLPLMMNLLEKESLENVTDESSDISPNSPKDPTCIFPESESVTNVEVQESNFIKSCLHSTDSSLLPLLDCLAVPSNDPPDKLTVDVKLGADNIDHSNTPQLPLHDASTLGPSPLNSVYNVDITKEYSQPKLNLSLGLFSSSCDARENKLERESDEITNILENKQSIGCNDSPDRENKLETDIYSEENTESLANKESLSFNNILDNQGVNTQSYTASSPLPSELGTNLLNDHVERTNDKSQEKYESESCNFIPLKYPSSSVESSSEALSLQTSKSEDDSNFVNNLIKSNTISNLDLSSSSDTQPNSSALMTVKLNSPKTSKSHLCISDNSISDSDMNEPESFTDMLEGTSTETYELTSENAPSSFALTNYPDKPEICSSDTECNLECSLPQDFPSELQDDNNESDLRLSSDIQDESESYLEEQKLEFSLEMLTDSEISLQGNQNLNLSPKDIDDRPSSPSETISDSKCTPENELESQLDSAIENVDMESKINEDVKLTHEVSLINNSETDSEMLVPAAGLDLPNSQFLQKEKLKPETNTLSEKDLERALSEEPSEVQNVERPDLLTNPISIPIEPSELENKELDSQVKDTLGSNSEEEVSSVIAEHLNSDSSYKNPSLACLKIELDAEENMKKWEYNLLSDSSENASNVKCNIVKELENKPILSLKKELDEVGETQEEHSSQDISLSAIKREEHSDPYEYMCKEEFDWDCYLEETNLEAAPPTAFLHVERSLETGVKEGQCLEVLESSHREKVGENELGEIEKKGGRWSSYWPAKVVSSCGHLLRVRFLGTFPAKSSNVAEFWRDLSSENIKPIGWSSSREIPMLLPSSLASLLENPNIDIENELNSLEPVPEEVFCEKTRELFARIQEGNLIEVLDSEVPREGCIVRVKQNRGGRLLLQDVLDEMSRPFWMFFLDPRIKPLGWIKQQEFYRYQSVEYSQFLENEVSWHNQPSRTFLASLQTSFCKHSLEVGMHLEAVMPTTLQSLHVAVVSSVVNESHFELTIEDHRWVTTLNDPLLLPCNFCRDHFLDLIPPKDNKEDFRWEEYLSSVGGRMAPQDIFPEQILGSDAGFEEGHKIEAVSPLDSAKIGIATIERIVGHLLLLKLDANPSILFYRPTSSMDIFPAGWTQSNGLRLAVPSPFTTQERDVRADQRDFMSAVPPEEVALAGSDHGKLEKVNNSMWCPRLYINHFCYPGPYLSKTKVAKMSQSVGPGPVSLVLRDVIGMTINSGYIPTRILRELQNLRMMNLSWQPIPLKAKFKRHILKANVNIPSTVRELGAFMLEFSKILMCCPNLWSHEPIGENCPQMCNKQNVLAIPSGAVVFKGGKGIRGYTWRKKRGGKKRLFYPLKTSATSQDDATDRVLREGDEEDFCEPDDGFEGEEVLSGSEGESRPSSPPCSEGPRKLKQKRMLSALEITMNESRVFDLTRDRGTKRTRGDVDPPSQGMQGAYEGSPSRRKRARFEDEPQNAIYGLEPADVTSDPLEWSVGDVERYVMSQPAIGHHAVRLREHEVDGRALLLLNLPSLVHHLRLPHGAAVALAQHICKVKMAHFLFFHPDRGQRR